MLSMASSNVDCQVVVTMESRVVVDETGGTYQTTWNAVSYTRFFLYPTDKQPIARLSAARLT